MLDQKNRLIDKLIGTKIRSQRDTKAARQRKTQIDTKRDRKIDTCMHIYIYILTYLLKYTCGERQPDGTEGQSQSRFLLWIDWSCRPIPCQEMWGVCGWSLPRAGLVPIPLQYGGRVVPP